MALLWITKDDLTMQRGIKELAKEVGVTPSYLCRVFKKTVGVTIGAYMKEFEKESSEGDTESSVQSPSKLGLGVMDVGTGLLTPATTTRSSSAPAEGRTGEPAEKDVGNVEESMNLDLDLDFDFNEWLCTDLLE